MKLLDRYVLWTFVKNYVIALMVLLGLYVVLDMVFNFDELAEVADKARKAGLEDAGALTLLRHIVDYYGYQVFFIFSLLSGIIPVVAAAFTIIRLTRFNEMTATLAAGIPLLRMAMPIILAAMVSNVLLIVDQELIIPRIIPMLTRKHDQVAVSDTAYAIKAMEDDGGRLLVAALYHPPGPDAPARMIEMSVVEHDEDFRPVSHLSADEATWDERENAWRLIGGRVITDITTGATSAQPADLYHSSITPEDVAIYRSGDYVNLLPTTRIKEMLAVGPAYGAAELQRVMHARFTQWVLNLLLLLLAVGTLLDRDPGRQKLGVMLCVLVTGLCMGAIFLSQQLAGTPPADSPLAPHWPAIMAWLPILIFGPVAVWLLDRVRT